MPSWLFMPVLYRDLAVGFIRQLMAVQGVSMPARHSGKVKAIVYMVTGIVGTLYYFTILLGVSDAVPLPCIILMYTLFAVTALTAVWTLIDYAMVIIKHNKA